MKRLCNMSDISGGKYEKARAVAGFAGARAAWFPIASCVIHCQNEERQSKGKKLLGPISYNACPFGVFVVVAAALGASWAMERYLERKEAAIAAQPSDGLADLDS